MKLASIIIETRPISNLNEIIQKHLDMLPVDTDLFIYYGSTNKHLIDFPLSTEFEIKDISLNEYNNLLTSSFFWNNYLNYDRVLVFQSDSMLLRKGIEEFYPYDYVGAAWSWQEQGGNGGCSLRNPKIMKEICEKIPYNTTLGNEDVYFSNIMYNNKIGNLAPREMCMKFGVEAMFTLGTLSYHAIDKWLTIEECNQIKTQYNE